MEGKKMFDYESTGNSGKKNEKEPQEVIAKILQVIIGFIMAVLHM